MKYELIPSKLDEEIFNSININEEIPHEVRVLLNNCYSYDGNNGYLLNSMLSEVQKGDLWEVLRDLSLLRINKYTVKKYLGSGHFGAVFLAYDEALQVEKAIKVITVENVQDILSKIKEAEILWSIKHDNIVAVYDANVYPLNSDLKIIIDMEYISGGSVEKAMQDNFLSVYEVTKYIIHVLYALENAHMNKILHRDIKPGNILIDGMTAKLSDFGLAINTGDSRFGSPNGYTSHLAPEVFVSGQTTEMSDVYAVGMTYLRLLNNINDWDGMLNKINATEELVIKGYFVDKIGFEKYVPSKIRKIVKKATAKDMKIRYKTAREMRLALERVKFAIDWIKKDETTWSGVSVMSDELYDLQLISKRKFRVELKKNSRRISEVCCTFDDERMAEEYILNHISESAIDS